MNVRIAAAALLVAVTASASATPSLDVTASCERRATKGRVICDVELEVASGRIAWADVVVMAAPPFAPPLRSRVGLADAQSRTDRRVRIPVALIATAQGKGNVTLNARATLCSPAEGAPATCRTTTREVATELIVGTDVER